MLRPRSAPGSPDIFTKAATCGSLSIRYWQADDRIRARPFLRSPSWRHTRNTNSGGFSSFLHDEWCPACALTVPRGGPWTNWATTDAEGQRGVRRCGSRPRTQRRRRECPDAPTLRNACIIMHVNQKYLHASRVIWLDTLIVWQYNAYDQTVYGEETDEPG